ncbi:choice-of-anchor B family protein [Psychrosphaera aquimarina]|uniref:Choice-of-anchor B family protein n=1 Tax=Psychrosphaera aquimarina TaxID=2044854 RepID=A0ABU3QZC5_9GAMM|nr:choice-of-anchor B family protein [Psychrosphaera aquimarina]MDU0112572.1 choice-of-anchor B family protein [Psychrosphaera aquimarina]
MKSTAVIIVIFLSVFSNSALAHAEHDKARYVAPNGIDTGRCELVEKPCLTIGYASSQANKGDKVLVAAGQYNVTSVDEIFYLTSQLIPAYGGYSIVDHYKKRDIDNNATYLNGIPLEYKEALSERGFVVMTDAKALDQIQIKSLKKKLASYQVLSESQSELTCSNNKAGEYPCDNIDLVAHVPLNQFASNPSAGNDIWGHVDLNTGTEYAIIGLNNGTAVVNLADPANPTVVDIISGSNAIWRDIKVYQYYDASLVKWQAYAYVSTDGATNGVAIINLSDLPNSAKLVKTSYQDNSLHNIYISNVNYTTGVAINGRSPSLHAMGSNKYGGAHRSYSLTDPESPSALYTPLNATRNDYTHDGTSFVVEDDRAQTQCQQTGDTCDVFVDFNEKEMRLWDQTNASKLKELGQGVYANAEYTHSGWWTEDKQYVYVHDELDEQRLGLNTSLHIFDVSDLTNPEYKGKWQGDTKSIDHNGFVRGNRYYMSNYERGMTVLDITNPIAPVEVGFFDTFPTSDSNSFNGAWGVYPFLPSGLILVSDINSGLYVLKDNTKAVAAGSLQFEQLNINAQESDLVTITVKRVNGSTGAISTNYRTLQGSATESDYIATQGTLTWEDGDTSAKSFTIQIINDEVESESTESLAIELYNVTGGATLYSPALAWVNILGEDLVGAVEIKTSGETVKENSNAPDNKTFDIKLTRFPPLTSSTSVELTQIISDKGDNAEVNTDFTLSNSVVSWDVDDGEDKTVTLTILNDSISENNEWLLLQLVAQNDARLGATTDIEYLILDDESNQTPTITATDHSAAFVTQYALKNLVAITDDDDPLSYLWQQVSGETITIDNPTSLDAMITLNQAGSYEFSLTVTDPFDQSATVTFTIEKLINEVNVPTPTPSKKGSSYGWLLLIMLSGLVLIRKLKQLVKH